MSDKITALELSGICPCYQHAEYHTGCVACQHAALDELEYLRIKNSEQNAALEKTNRRLPELMIQIETLKLENAELNRELKIAQTYYVVTERRKKNEAL